MISTALEYQISHVVVSKEVECFAYEDLKNSGGIKVSLGEHQEELQSHILSLEYLIVRGYCLENCKRIS